MSELPTFYTPAQVAEVFGITENFVARNLRDWPHFRIARQPRFTAEHVAEIARMFEHQPPAQPVAASHGQRTRRSRS